MQTRALLGRFSLPDDDKQRTGNPLSIADVNALGIALNDERPAAFLLLFSWNTIYHGAQTSCHPVLRPMLTALSKSSSLARTIRNAGAIAPLLHSWASGDSSVFEISAGRDRANYLLLADSCVWLHQLLTQFIMPVGDAATALRKALRPLVSSIADHLSSLVAGFACATLCASAGSKRAAAFLRS